MGADFAKRHSFRRLVRAPKRMIPEFTHPCEATAFACL